MLKPHPKQTTILYYKRDKFIIYQKQNTLKKTNKTLLNITKQEKQKAVSFQCIKPKVENKRQTWDLKHPTTSANSFVAFTFLCMIFVVPLVSVNALRIIIYF